VESELGRGSQFHFTALLAIADKKAIEVGTIAPPEILRAVKVLVVDDNRHQQRILEGMLGRWEMKSSSAQDGEEALTKLSEAQEAGKPFALDLDGHAHAQNGRVRIDCENPARIHIVHGDQRWSLSSAGRRDQRHRRAMSHTLGRIGIPNMRGHCRSSLVPVAKGQKSILMIRRGRYGSLPDSRNQFEPVHFGHVHVLKISAKGFPPPALGQFVSASSPS